MLVIGSLLALISGMLNAGAAALEKREGMRSGTGRKGFRLLAVLAKRPLWLLAMALSAVAWVAEAASLALAPVAVVATVRNAGRGLLVVGGRRWLEEHFSRLELAGVALASAGGALTTASAAHTAITRRPLSNLTEVAVGATCLIGAGAVEWSFSRLARDKPARARASGVATGAAVGLLFAGTGVFTKEIGDRIALYGAGGIPPLLASAGPWLMLVISALFLIYGRGIFPRGVVPLTLILAAIVFVGFCLIACAASVSEGWAIALTVVCNSSYWLVWYGLMQLPAVTTGLKSPVVMWNSTVLTILGGEFGLIALVLGLTFFLQSRKRDFV